jgi:ankyrin repeat protein
MLLEHGADVNAQNKDGLTPFVLASRCGLAEIIHVLEQYGADSGAHDLTTRIEFHSGVICESDADFRDVEGRRTRPVLKRAPFDIP